MFIRNMITIEQTESGLFILFNDGLFSYAVASTAIGFEWHTMCVFSEL